MGGERGWGWSGKTDGCPVPRLFFFSCRFLGLIALALIVSFTGTLAVSGAIVETAGCLPGCPAGGKTGRGRREDERGRQRAEALFHFLLVNTLDLPDGPNLDAAATL